MKKISSVFLGIVILCSSMSAFADWEGSGFQITGHTSYTSPNVKNGSLRELPIEKKTLASPQTVAVSVSSRNVIAKVHEYADVVSDHGVYITNTTPTTQNYRVELYTLCGNGLRDEVFYITLKPNGRASNGYQMSMSEEVDTPGNYDIKTFTQVSSVENNYMELHYTFSAHL